MIVLGLTEFLNQSMLLVSDLRAVVRGEKVIVREHSPNDTYGEDKWYVVNK